MAKIEDGSLVVVTDPSAEDYGRIGVFRVPHAGWETCEVIFGGMLSVRYRLGDIRSVTTDDFVRNP